MPKTPKTPIADLAARVRAWYASKTGLDPIRAESRILAAMVWLEAMGLASPLPAGEVLGDLERCTLHECADPQWNQRHLRADHEKKAHRIGRQQKRGESPRWLYMVPPEPPEQTEEQLEIEAPGKRGRPRKNEPAPTRPAAATA